MAIETANALIRRASARSLQTAPHGTVPARPQGVGRSHEPRRGTATSVQIALIRNSLTTPRDQAGVVRHRIAEPVGRRQPDEREDRDHPEVVGQRRALVGPEERAVEDAADAPRATASAACSARDTCSRSGSRRRGSTAPGSPTAPPAIRLVNAPIMKQHDALGPLHEADLALLDQRLGARARVARHDREDQRQRRDHHVVAAAQLRVQEDQAGQQREIGEAIERRVPERAELRLQLRAGARPCRR